VLAKSFGIVALTAFFVTIAPFTARGQGGDSGSIVGYVFDQSGNPVRGVKVIATSATQIGGAKTAYTNDEGAFRIRALIPGVFEVKATAATLRTVVQKDVRVGITSAAELNFIMEVSTTVEEVKVVEKSPLVSTTKPNLREEFNNDFVEALPHHGRDNIHRDMLGSVAGSMSNRMRGGAQNQTVVTQDGFDMGPPGKTISPALKSSAAFEVQTGGYGADNPTASGGILNLVTRSGSNQFEFEFNASADHNALQLFRDSRDTRSNTFYYVLNPMVAGPIIKDKLWYFFNTETHLTQDGRQRDVEGISPDPVPRQRFIQKGSVKLTWQVTGRNTLSAITNYELIPREINRVDGLGIDQDAQEVRSTQRIFLGVIWNSVLKDNLLLKSQVGGTYIPEHIYPQRCLSQPIDCEHIPSTIQTIPRQLRTGNNNNHTRTDVYGLQFINQLDWFPEGSFFGEHNLSIKDRFYTEQEIRKQSRPGNLLYETRDGSTPVALTEYYSNDPRYEDAHFGWYIGTDWLSKNVVTLADNWKPTRYLTVTPSLSHIWATASDSRGNLILSNQTFAPGLAAIWDPTHDGRMAVRGSLSTYVDADVGAVARHGLGSQTQKRCTYNAANGLYDQGCVYSGGLSPNTIGKPCGPSGVDETGADCQQKLQLPRTYELTAGAEREVVQGLAVSLDYVFRRYNNQYEINESNRIWNPSGSQVVGYRNGRAETVSDLETPDGAYRRYDGISIGVTKREGRVKTRASYSWSRLYGTAAGGTGNLWGDIPGRDQFTEGYLSDDHRHEVKVSVSYQATQWLSFGSRTTYTSGQPYNRFFRNDETGTFDSLRAPVGVNPSTTPNDRGGYRPLRLPDLLEVNVQTRLSLLPLIGHKLDFYVDVTNILGLRTATAFGTNDGQDFGVERAWMPPLSLRLGLNYRY
jgi:hypothetical protein